MVSGEKKPFSGAPFKMGSSIHAVAGIGNPQRFFNLLEELPYPVTSHAFPDHHQYRPEDFQDPAFTSSAPIVMTEKDGIKCEAFADDRFWTLDIAVQVDAKLLEQVCLHVREFA
jgi:tetraacyldisaccharide 4'-kinase